MALQLTVSCDSDKIETGPTLIHSTGVEHYKIPPDVIRILQESLTNELLSDDEQGVLCKVGSQRVLDLLLQNGFTQQNQTDDDQKTTWVLVQNGGESERAQPVHPSEPEPTPDDGNGADAGEEDQGGDGGGGGDDQDENKQEEEEE